MLLLSIVVRYDHDSGIWGVITFFVYPKGGGHHFFSFDKGGHVFLWGVLLVATGPPPVEIMNGPLHRFCQPPQNTVRMELSKNEVL